MSSVWLIIHLYNAATKSKCGTVTKKGMADVSYQKTALLLK